MRPWENVHKVAACSQKQQAIKKQLKMTLRTELATQRIPKDYPKPQKEVPKVSKFMPADHLRAQKQAIITLDQKKIEFGRLGTSKIMPKELQI